MHAVIRLTPQDPEDGFTVLLVELKLPNWALRKLRTTAHLQQQDLHDELAARVLETMSPQHRENLGSAVDNEEITASVALSRVDRHVRDLFGGDE